MSLGCLILAAGFGTRMGALTADRPKPLIPVAGRPLVSHAVRAAEGATRIAVNGHYRAGQLAAALAAEHPEVTFLHEADAILDSGGGLRNALSVLPGDPVATLNADAVWAGPPPLSLLVEAWDGARMDGLMLLCPPSRVHGRDGPGDVTCDADGRVTFERRAGAPVYIGAQMLARDVVAAEPAGAFPMRRIWDRVAARGRLFGVVYPGHWADVGHPGGIAAAEAMLAAAGVPL